MKIIYLIVGLGNPGKKYEHTRHNVGFDFVDEFANKLGIDIDKDGFKGKYALCKYFDKDIILLKPQTFMNNSGESIIEIVNYFKIDIDNILKHVKCFRCSNVNSHFIRTFYRTN